MPNRSVAILGAGVAGLSAAFDLRRRGINVTVFEAQNRVGGVIRSERTAGYLLEHGPNSIQPNEDVSALIESAGFSGEVVDANPLQRNRYVVRDGRLIPVPLRPPDIFRTPLFSLRGKVRLLAEPFVGTGAPSESVAQFVRRRVGQEFLDYAIDPFVAGVYAGDPELLSMRHAFPRMAALEANHGSLIRGMLASRKSRSGMPKKKRLISFRDGMETIPRALGRHVEDGLQTGAAVQGVSRRSDGWAIQLSNGEEREGFDAVVASVPSYAVRELLPRETASWPVITHPAVTVVGLGYARGDIEHPLDGFGVLVPSVERSFRILGALFSSTLFPGRAPDGSVLITVFLGGMRHRDAFYLAGDEAARVAHEDLARLLSIRADPSFS